MKRSFWTAVTIGVAAGAWAVIEQRRPLRRRREPGIERVGRNLTIGLLAALTTAAGDALVVRPAQRLAERRRLGLLRWLRFPRALRVAIGFLLLDYTLYLWHWWNHRSAALWRFHAVHHVDLDLDSTTGIRFHFGELALATAFRAVQVLILGVDRAALTAWQRLLFASVIFHHSNVELPIGVERRLVRLLATPRMHGIHHSRRAADLHSNFASLLSCWDRLHGTLRLNVLQASITSGVTGFDSPEEVSLRTSLLLPFSADRRLESSLLRLDRIWPRRLLSPF